MRYCVIVYVGHFWPPSFGLISVQSLIYTPKCLIFTLIYFLRLPPLFVSICVYGELAQYANKGGRGHVGGKKSFADVRAELLWQAIYCAKTRPDTGYQYGS